MKEIDILESVYHMGIESLSPDSFENLINVLKELCQSRHIRLELGEQQ